MFGSLRGILLVEITELPVKVGFFLLEKRTRGTNTGGLGYVKTKKGRQNF